MNTRTWIRARWGWATSLALAVCAVSVLALGYYKHEGQLIREQAHQNLDGIAKLKVGQIEAWRKERIADALILTRSPLLRDAIQRYLSAPDRASARAQVLGLLRLVKDYMVGYSEVMITDADGNILVGLDPGQHDLDASAKQLAARAATVDNVVFGDFVRCLDCNEIHLDLTAPILNGEGRALAVVLLRIDPMQSLYPLIERWPTPSKTAETLLVRRESGDALVLNALRFQRDSALTLRIPLSRTSTPAVRAALGHVGFFEGTDYRGMRVVSDVLAVEGSPWYMVAKVDSDEILAELRYRGLIVLGFGLLSILLTSGGAVNFYHWRQRNLYRQLHKEQIERLALTAHYEHVVRYAHDAMILADGEMRVVEANDRALALYECTREEIYHLTVAAVRAPSDAPAFDPHDDALLHGVTFETTHRKKDGTPFPVEVSARVIQVDGERYYHEIIRDITDRKMAEAALKNSNELFRTTLYSIGDAVITTDRNGLIRTMNTVGETLTGYSEADACGRPSAEVFRVFSEETGERSACIVERVLREGVVIGLGNHSELEARGGARRPVEDSGAPIRDASGAVTGVVLVFRDVSEGRAAENALLESEKRYRRLAENAPDLIYRYEFGPERRCAYVSPPAMSITGTHPPSFMPIPTCSSSSRGRSAVPSQGSTYLAMAPPISPREVKLVRKDGKEITVEIHEMSVYDETGAHVATEGIVRDITERRRSEEALRRLSLVVEQAPVSVVITDTEGNIEYVNPAFTATSISFHQNIS